MGSTSAGGLVVVGTPGGRKLRWGTSPHKLVVTFTVRIDEKLSSKTSKNLVDL